MRRHSDRAKRNSTNGIRLRIDTIFLKIEEIEKEIVLYIRYQKKFPLGTTYSWISKVLRVLRKKKRIRQAQLARYKDRYAQRKREGKVF